MAVQRIIIDVEMIDGTEHLGIKTVVADQMRFSTARKKHNWPALADDPLFGCTFMAWAALSRLGKYSESWDQFCADAAAVSEAGVEDVDPSTATPSNV